jgi:predicted outer membrane repeat protein
MSLPSQYPTIQSAIDDANDGDTVIVAPGNYTGPGNRDIDFLGKAITVRSTDPNDPNIVSATIINCQGTYSEPHNGFMFYKGEGSGSVLEGLAITKAYCYGYGGIWCKQSSPTINNCIISDSRNSGILCSNSNPMINNCIISNSTGSGIRCSNSNPMITNCTITTADLTSMGGGIYCSSSSPIITSCVISANTAGWRGGAIYCCDYSSLKITNCTITGNESRGGLLSKEGGGGICCQDSSIMITSCTIIGNISDYYGGGIYCDGSNLKITNCTVTSNIAKKYGGSIYCRRSNATITNCILYDNVAPDGPQIYLEDDSNVSVNFTDVQGGQTEIYVEPGSTLNWLQGNIDTDPCFVQLGYWDANDTPDFWVEGDYHLKSAGWRWDSVRGRWDYDEVTSRCIDAGNPGSPLGDEPLSVPDDPENKWGQNLRIDMGAFGGTAEASMPPYDWALLADLTNDGLVDLVDFAYQAADWLNSADQQRGDLNRDSLVDISDLALLVEDWLKQTAWHE